MTLTVLPSYPPCLPTMSNSELNLSKIPILQSQSNYHEWSLEVKATAQLKGFWKAILGTNTTTSTDESEKDKVEQREMKAMGLMMKTILGVLKVELHKLQITDSSVTSGFRDPTVKDLWEHLKLKFEKKDGVSAILDLGQLTQSKLIDNGTLKTQLNAMQDVCSQCALNDIKFEDWQYVTLILLPLPKTYKHITDSFLTTGVAKDLKPADVCAKILETKICRKADTTSTTNALLAKPAGKKKVKKPPPDQPCFKCRKTGHWARHCKAKPKNSSTTSSFNSNMTGTSSLNVVENSDAESDSPVFCYFGAPKSWLVDSGVTNHMTPFGSDFKTYTAFANSHNVVLLADGSTKLPILSKGTIEHWVETSPMLTDYWSFTMFYTSMASKVVSFQQINSTVKALLFQWDNRR